MSAPASAPAGHRAARWLLGVLALSSLIPGACAAVAPHAFYDTVIGVDLLGPYNQHLLTDVGGLYLGFGLLFTWAAVTLGRELALGACAVWALTQVLHFIFHVVHLAHFTFAEALEQSVGLAAYLVLLLVAALLVGRADHA